MPRFKTAFPGTHVEPQQQFKSGQRYTHTYKYTPSATTCYIHSATKNPHRAFKKYFGTAMTKLDYTHERTKSSNTIKPVGKPKWQPTGAKDSPNGMYKIGPARQHITHHDIGDGVSHEDILPEHIENEGFRGHTHLNTIHIDPKYRGKGHGTKAFEKMTKWADENNRVLSLMAGHFENKSYNYTHKDEHGPTKIVDGKHVKNFLHTDELEKFYGKHGFEKDHATGDMWRLPQEVRTVAKVAKAVK
jgi:GNAT superfamily N-acetyltransferase